jgi:Asp-tRNA(Asn)/Glu-tRNA(Gln) amidotransferase A subunit family amidase
VGISFIGPAYSEVKLVNMAAAYERANKVRKPPRFLARAEEAQPS